MRESISVDDRAILKNLITKGFKYIGVIGSSTKLLAMKEDIKKMGSPTLTPGQGLNEFLYEVTK